ncbi:potassium-transporting ATPase subunit F [Spirosoma validum]|nr:potassium-transporting ATPase subunit F [Spirosoma validum]
MKTSKHMITLVFGIALLVFAYMLYVLIRPEKF